MRKVLFSFQRRLGLSNTVAAYPATVFSRLSFASDADGTSTMGTIPLQPRSTFAAQDHAAPQSSPQRSSTTASYPSSFSPPHQQYPPPASASSTLPPPAVYPSSSLEILTVFNSYSHPELFQGAAQCGFSDQALNVLQQPLSTDLIEIKPTGEVYLPTYAYRRILNLAFKPGGWALRPVSPPVLRHGSDETLVYREYALYCQGKFVSSAIGEQKQSKTPAGENEAVAIESGKSNALSRCCKDLGIATELWDLTFIERFKSQNCVQVMCTHSNTGQKRLLWRRKDRAPFSWPWQEPR